MIKKLGAFLFACSLSASYAFAAGDASQCNNSCWQKFTGCANSLGSGSPICNTLYNHCLSSCQQ